MSIHFQKMETGSIAHESSDQYLYGDHYFHLRDFFRQCQRFTTKAYLPSHGGLKTVTNQDTVGGTLRILIDAKNKKEPDESDSIFFTEDFLRSIGLNHRKLKTRKPEDDYDPETTGVYKKISSEIAERIEKESNDKKAG
ncbi:MAG: hypothetical protein U0519_01300 [Candidatus Gracilibacteria bacterium]